MRLVSSLSDSCGACAIASKVSLSLSLSLTLFICTYLLLHIPIYLSTYIASKSYVYIYIYCRAKRATSECVVPISSKRPASFVIVFLQFDSVFFSIKTCTTLLISQEPRDSQNLGGPYILNLNILQDNSICTLQSTL